ncbi:dehydrogenase [Sphingorhabdus lutea]|uniref:Dehydrogenase n=1 Tax=Sphingorhabdus lutea TaxID=1913578 RepID=A0A1L3JD06_9SPHN|nr:PQQ-dependent sugar dehydrogenase [Sphingorhabdus lutea]APG63015.1 dehydrogenase [Sphingorhabdus lutea]
MNKISIAKLPLLAASLLAFSSCNAADVDKKTPVQGAHNIEAEKPFNEEIIAQFNEPWAMAFVPESPYALITEKSGKMLLWRADDEILQIANVPKVDYGGQGGLGDVVISPDYLKTGHIYFSWVEAGENDTRGAVVARAKLRLDGDGAPALDNINIIWKQFPKVTGRGHFSHRIAFSPDGRYIFIGSGERQKFDPAQDMSANLGKIIRLNLDGSIPQDNPFAAQGGIAAQIWSLGHRNILGITFDLHGNLWNQEMGPAGGDELNLVQKGANYGYPTVSNGDHYDGRDIPDHSAKDGFEAPALWWNPAVSPGGLMTYNGNLFPQWRGSLFMGGLGAQSLIRIKLNGKKAEKGEQWNMEMRVREVENGPDGAIWILEDGGKMIRLTPK